MEKNNPRFMFFIRVDKHLLTRTNLKKGQYDDSKSNLLCSKFSLKTSVKIISWTNLLFIFLFMLVYTLNIINYLSNLINNNNNSNENSNSELSKNNNNNNNDFLLIHNTEYNDNTTYENNSYVGDYNYIRDLFLIFFQSFAFIFLLISSKNYSHKLANVGLFIYQLIFWAHFSLFIVLVVYYVIGDFNLFLYNTNSNDQLFENIEIIVIIFSCLIFLVIEVYFVWICFKYTYNLLIENDAYVDGEYFNKYVENLASLSSHNTSFSIR